MKKIPNIHPGEILLEEFLIPLKMSQNQLARDINVSPRRVNEIILGKRSITTDTSLRLAKYFGISEFFFLNLQNRYDLKESKNVLSKILPKIIPLKTKINIT